MIIHFIIFKSKYLRELIQKFDSSIQYNENDLVDYEADLAHLYQPFKGLLNIYKNNLNRSIKDIRVYIEPPQTKIQTDDEVKQKVIKSLLYFL